jgi:serine/threonine protein kinase
VNASFLDTDIAFFGTHRLLSVFMDGYIEHKELAAAMYGSVVLASSEESGDLVVIKKLNKKNARAFKKVYLQKNIHGRVVPVPYIIKEDAMFEMDTLAKLQQQSSHNNLVQLRELLEDSTFYYIVLDYVGGGELFELVARNGRINENVACEYFSQMASAVSFLHGQGICHRDLSLENWIVTEDKKGVVLIDFGLGAKLDGRHGKTNHVLGVCGKGFYIAPEVKATGENEPYCGVKADAWSAGVCLFMMLFGCPPLETPNDSDQRFQRIKRGELRTMVQEWGIRVGEEAHSDGHDDDDDTTGTCVSHEAMEVLERLLVSDPHQRAMLEQVLQMPWLNKNCQCPHLHASLQKQGQHDSKTRQVAHRHEQVESKPADEDGEGRKGTVGATDTGKRPGGQIPFVEEGPAREETRPESELAAFFKAASVSEAARCA